MRSFTGAGYRRGGPRDVPVSGRPGAGFIKRVVGVAGETVEIWNKVVYLDGRPLTSPTPFFTDPDPEPNSLRDHGGPKVVPDHSCSSLVKSGQQSRQPPLGIRAGR